MAIAELRASAWAGRQARCALAGDPVDVENGVGSTNFAAVFLPRFPLSDKELWTRGMHDSARAAKPLPSSGGALAPYGSAKVTFSG